MLQGSAVGAARCSVILVLYITTMATLANNNEDIYNAINRVSGDNAAQLDDEEGSIFFLSGLVVVRYSNNESLIIS